MMSDRLDEQTLRATLQVYLTKHVMLELEETNGNIRLKSPLI